MPRFFFHIILTDGMRIEDEEGRDIADLETAREAGLALARNIVFNLKNAAEPVEDLDSIQIADEVGSAKLTVRFADFMSGDSRRSTLRRSQQ